MKRVALMLLSLVIWSGFETHLFAQTSTGGTQEEAKAEVEVKGSDDEGMRILAVGEAEIAKEKISIVPSYLEGALNEKDKKLLIGFEKLLQNDFSFYRNRFEVPSYEELRTQREQEKGKISPLFYAPSYEDWRQKKTDYLVQLKGQAFGRYVKIMAVMYDIRQQKLGYKTEKVIIINNENYRAEGHKLADDLFQVIVKKPSIFTSKIFFVSDRDSTPRKQMKELYMVDFDGFNPVRLTRHEGIVISPEVSFDRHYVAYTLIEERNKQKVRNLDLYLLDVQTKRTEKVSSRKGINSGAAFLPDGESIALTLSFSGTAQIYVMNLKTKALRQLTTTGDNVDPSISYDGKTLTFLSDRPGKAMIYKMDPSEKEKDVTRLSYVGKFHATPRIAPNGKDVVFASWVDKTFDLYRIDINGNNIIRLTKDFGNNENPSFSNDGEFIVFSNERVFSQKKASFQLMIMDRDGEILGNISQDLGNCFAPRWSK